MLVANNIDCTNYMCQFLCYIDNICVTHVDKSHYQNITLPNFKELVINKLVACYVVPSLEEAKLFCDTL